MLEEGKLSSIRLDTWLWAARFFRSRSLAQQAIKGGKVHSGNTVCKPGQSIKVGQTLNIRQGYDKLTVIVTALASKRGNATQAALLYQETPESIAQRDAAALNRKLANASVTQAIHKPDKHKRAQLRDLKRGN